MVETAEQNNDLLIGFIDESVDSLQDLPNLLDQYQTNDTDSMNQVFRAVHSIKGNAGFFGLTAINKFSHSLENTLDDIRNGKVSLQQDLQRSLVEGFDILDGMLQSVLSGDLPDDVGSHEQELLQHIDQLAREHGSVDGQQQLLNDVLAIAQEIEEAQLPKSQEWSSRLRAAVASEEDGEENSDGESSDQLDLEPSSLVGGKFEIESHDISQHVASILDMFVVAKRGEYQPEQGEIFLKSCDRFAEWAEEKELMDLCASVTQASADFKTIFDSPLDVDWTLISVVWEGLAPKLAAARSADAKEDDKSEGDDQPQAAAASSDQASNAKSPQTTGRLIRVKEEYLDEFLEDVSNLFVSCERLKNLQSRVASEQVDKILGELREINATLSSQTHALQQSVVGLRKVPIRGLFSKFPRMARSLASKLEKKIDVHLIGEAVEIDKSLFEDLDGPLTHMVRNVVDHGIETPEERSKRGASESGNLWIKADLTRSHVVIRIEDDGRGIDPNKLRNKAVEKEIMTEAAAANLPDDEAVALIFHPGFSTAEKVSDISGRGVGLDVVRTTIRDHGGDVKVESALGKGTKFSLEFPIRSAVVVVDGLLIESGGEVYVLPFEHIREVVELDTSNLKSVHGSHVATIQSTNYAAAPLCEIFGHADPNRDNLDKRQGVLIGCKEGALCLVVDNILGHRKVVVNSLKNVVSGTEQFAGVSEIGGGQLALVLSPPELINTMQESERVSC